MTKQITSAIVLGLMVAFSTSHVNAQIGAKLNGLKEKVTGGGEGSSNSKSKEGTDGKSPKLSEEEKDKADTFLDGMEFAKDEKGVNGVYLSTEPFYCMNDLGNGVKKIQKFLLEYIVDEEMKYHQVKLSSRYAYEESNRAKFVKPIIFTSPSTFAYDIKASRSTGGLYMGGLSFTRSTTKQAIWERNLQNKWVYDRDDLLSMPDNLYMVEPGIFLILKRWAPVREIDINEYREKQPVIVLYKPEKEEQAMKYTGKLGYETAEALLKKHEDAFDQAKSGNAQLPKSIASFKEEPANSALVEAVKKRMAEMPYYKNKQLAYVYNVAPWEQMFESVGIMGKTLTYRQMQVVAVFKDGSKCQYARMLIRQDNTYVAGTSQEKWTGNPLFCNGDQQLEDIGCDKAMTYKK